MDYKELNDNELIYMCYENNEEAENKSLLCDDAVFFNSKCNCSRDFL